VTTGNRLARLPVGLGADRPAAVPRGNCGGPASELVTPGSGVGPALTTPLLGTGGPERDGLGEGDGLGDGDLLGDGEGLGEGDLLGEGDGLGEGDLLGDGEGLGEGELLGDGDPADRLGDGDGAPIAAGASRARAGLAAAPVLPRTAMRIPAATALPPASARAPARPGRKPW